MTPLRYTKTGRLFTLPTGQFEWKGKVRQNNIQLPDRSFVPYIFDATDKSVRFGDMTAKFRPQGIELFHLRDLRTTIQIHPETFKAGQWNRSEPTRNPLQVVNVSRAESRDYLDIILRSGTSDLVVEMRLRIGGSNKITWKTELLATNAGQHRAMVEFSGLPDVPQPITRYQPGTNQRIELPPIKYRLGGLVHAWRASRPNEEALHTIDGDSSLTRIGLGEGQYVRNQRKIITPDTTGELPIGVDADDGDEIRDNTWSAAGNAGDGNLYIDDDTASNSNLALGLGWRAIDLNTTSPGVASIDSGTQIHCFNGGTNGNPENVECVLYGSDVAGGNVWSSSVKPSTVTQTAASTTVSPTTSDQTIPCAGILGEWVITDGVTYEGNTGDDMYLFIINSTAGNGDFWSGCQDYDGAGAAEETGLTIVFTPTSAGAAAPPVGSLALLGAGL